MFRINHAGALVVFDSSHIGPTQRAVTTAHVPRLYIKCYCSVSRWTQGVQVKLLRFLESALDVCSRRGARQIHVYLYLYRYWS